jgi:hypothetical protein
MKIVIIIVIILVITIIYDNNMIWIILLLTCTWGPPYTYNTVGYFSPGSKFSGLNISP